MTSKDTWAQVAEALARRLALHAACIDHDSVRSGVARGCPACADIAVMRRFERHHQRARGAPWAAPSAAAGAQYDVPLPLDDEELLDAIPSAAPRRSGSLVGAHCQTP